MQKQEISLYNFGGYEIRTLSDEGGNPLFIAADVAKALDYRDAANMTRILDGCEIRGTRLVSTSSSNQYGAVQRQRPIPLHDLPVHVT